MPRSLQNKLRVTVSLQRRIHWKNWPLFKGFWCDDYMYRFCDTGDYSSIYEVLLAGKQWKDYNWSCGPRDVAPEVLDHFAVTLIDINQLRSIAEKDMEERQSEFMSAEEIIDENIHEFRHLHRTRSLELKMKEVPEKSVKSRIAHSMMC